MKRIVGVELSHQKAPLAIREKISFGSEDLEKALEELKSELSEVFVVATCNRLAIYALSEDIQPLVRFFRHYGPLDPYLSIFDSDTAAIRHLFATASGLESQAIGEHEILGQIKKAYAKAQEVQCVGPIMDEFVRRAIFVGKKVRKETAIGQHPVSLASVGYDVIRTTHKNFEDTSVLVLGTGEMSNLMLKILIKKSMKNLYVASRTFDRAESLAHMYNGKAVDMQEVGALIDEVDVVVGATHTSEFVVNFATLENKTYDKPKTFIDLGLPRNFDPDLKRLDSVKLYDLDDLKSMTYQGMLRRQEEVPKAMDIVDQEMKEFMYWFNTRQISPVISSYYEKIERIREEELQWAMPKLGELDENQVKIIEAMVSRITRRVSGKPIERLKDFSQEPHVEKKPIDTFKELFDLE